MGDMKRQSRREFMRTAAAAAAGTGVVLRSAASWARVVGANDRVNFAVIGCGGMGTRHVRELVERRDDWNVDTIAVCDIYEPRKNRARDISGGRLFHDYRELLDVKDVDAVVIATPDHWHARNALDSLDAGKHVYLQKPMTHTWEEAKAVCGKVRRTRLELQVGTQHASSDRWWRAREAIRQGYIGKVLWSQGSYSRNSKDGEWNYRIDPDAGPDNLDWKAFLGPAPDRPFSRERYFRWRKYWDYSGGIATDLFYHKLGPMLIALGPEFPTRVTSAGGIYQHLDREVPDTFFTTIDYPSDHTIVLCSSMANSFGVEDIVRGHEASIILQGDRVVIRSEGTYRDRFAARYGSQEVEIATEPRTGHMENFINAIRGEEPLHFDAEIGYRTQVAISLGVLAYRRNRVMGFDPVKEALAEDTENS